MNHRIDYIGLALVSRLIIPIMLISSTMLFYWFTRNLWFFVYEFRLEGNLLEIHDPILHKRWLMTLNQVSTIGTFNVLGPTSGSAAASGYLLKTDDGLSVTLSGALPICQEILQKCGNATFDKINMMNFK